MNGESKSQFLKQNHELRKEAPIIDYENLNFCNAKHQRDVKNIFCWPKIHLRKINFDLFL